MTNYFRRFYNFLWHYRRAYLIFIVVLVLAAILDNLDPYLYKLLVDAIPRRDYRQLLRLLFILVGLRLVTNAGNTLSNYLGDRVAIPSSRDVRLAVFRQIQDLDFAFHVNKNTGSLISAFKRGDGAFFDLFHDLHFDIFRVFLSLLVAMAFFTRVTPIISGLLLLVFVGNVWLSWRLIQINIKRRSVFNEAEDRISGIIADNLINYETVKFFAQEKTEEHRLQTQFRDWSAKFWRYANSFRLMDICIGSLSNLGTLVVFWVVIKKVVAGELGAGDFVLVASFMTGFYYQFFQLLYHLRSIARSYVDIQRYFGVLDEGVLVQDPAKPAKLERTAGELRFEDVDFAYPDAREAILKDIDLTITPGETVAFVGRSGAGKTTFVRILLRFYDVTQGRVTIDGVDIRNFAKSQLRSLMGVVPQEPILFNNTIGYNIAYGKSAATQEEIIRVSQMANLHDFIESLPKKYDTEVGERGIKLSGGQKQRLAIARMLLIDPKIIIFDEATSNLDSESEQLIQDALWKIAEGRTVLIIAHRFSTIRKADRIVVMENGRIVETGAHEELVHKDGGVYRHLWELQVKGQLEQLEDEDLLED